MNGIHDMGGMHGFGPVEPDKDEAPFHAEWEGRVFALQLAMAPHLQSNSDRFRSTVEQIRPDGYLRMSYFERWMECIEVQAVAAGVLSEADRSAVRAGQAPPSRSGSHASLPAAAVREILQHGRAPERPVASSGAFSVGQLVRARNLNPVTHTRLPRYARGKPGVVVADRGDHVFPDTNAVQRDGEARRLYGVRFVARDLWGEDANPNDSVHLDLWEPYLEPA